MGDLETRIVEFLFNPQSSGKAFKSGKRKRSAKKAKKSMTPRKTSRYMMYCKDKRPSVKKKNPEAAFGEIGKLLGAAWSKLGDQAKAEWTEKGAAEPPKEKTETKKAKKTASAKKAKKTKKTKKKAEPETEDEEDDDSDEDSPLAIQVKGLGAKMEAKITKIIDGADLSELTIKKIKTQLKAEFGDELIDSKKKEIKEFVGKAVKAKSE